MSDELFDHVEFIKAWGGNRRFNRLSRERQEAIAERLRRKRIWLAFGFTLRPTTPEGR